MTEVEWMSAAVKLFDITIQILQKFFKAQQELRELKKQLDSLHVKLTCLEEKYGYDTVR